VTLSTTGPQRRLRWPAQPPEDKTDVAASVYCCPDVECLFDAMHYVRERTGHLVEYHPFAGDQ
jgi:hypothetical protein